MDLTEKKSFANDDIRGALSLPKGARYYKCALQVNSYTYQKRHGNKPDYDSEEAYNQAMVQACKENGIDVIGVTDHYRIQTAESLIEAARKDGITVFPGFEAATKNNIHFLVLFDPSKTVEEVDRHIASLVPVKNQDDDSPLGSCDVHKLLQYCNDHDAACIAAHVTQDSGILQEMRGKPRIKAWKDDNLLAVSVPCPPGDMSHQGMRQILKNRDHNHERDQLPAILMVQDVDEPADMAKEKSWTWIRMAEPTVEGLRQAFLDPDSRIRLPSEPDPEDRAEFLAMTWDGGFLDGVRIHFSEDMNVLIGGRGTGKSTVIESLRYVLQQDAVGEEAQRMHKSIVQQVLGSGTKVSLLIRIARPSIKEYLIERTVPNPPKVKDTEGNILDMRPEDVLEEVEIYGQHEVAELAKDRTKLTRLLDRFADIDPDLEEQKESVQRELEDTRRDLTDVRRKVRDIEERLGQLPVIEEKIKQFKAAGIDEKLNTKSQLVKEEKVLKTADERIEKIEEIRKDLADSLPLEKEFVSESALDDLPNRDVLEPIQERITTLNKEAERVEEQLQSAVDEAKEKLKIIRESWSDREAQVQEEYEDALRELQEEQVDGEEYIRLQRKAEELRPLRKKLDNHKKHREEVEQRRRNLLGKWEDLKTKEYRAYETACNRVSQALGGQVKATVQYQGDRSPLIDLLDRELEGRRQEMLDALESREDLSLKELTEHIEDGADTLVNEYGLTQTQAQTLADIDENLRLQIEELELPASTEIELNVAADGQGKEWRPLDKLSTGQRATAVLLLLLIESKTPLVVDQPEDDLDNRFVVDGVVPAIRSEKGRRQFLFATHNANIPVLGDAEQILGFSAVGDARINGRGRAAIQEGHRGAIDQPSVRALVEEILEGGKTAFEKRRAKYGF
jgi:energy-coupling factor transporter ATP-binding protein EcfA2